MLKRREARCVTGMKFRLRKRQQALGVARVNGDSSSDAGICADDLWHFLCACTVVFPWKELSR